METIYTQESRLGECIFLLCAREPSVASAIGKTLDAYGLSNGAKIIAEQLALLHPQFQSGLPFEISKPLKILVRSN